MSYDIHIPTDKGAKTPAPDTAALFNDFWQFHCITVSGFVKMKTHIYEVSVGEIDCGGMQQGPAVACPRDLGHQHICHKRCCTAQQAEASTSVSMAACAAYPGGGTEQIRTRSPAYPVASAPTASTGRHGFLRCSQRRRPVGGSGQVYARFGGRSGARHQLWCRGK